MDAIRAFRVSGQRRPPDLPGAAGAQIRPLGRTLLRQVVHLVKLAIRVINNAMPIELESHFFPGIFPLKQRVSSVRFSREWPKPQSFSAIDEGVDQEQPAM